MTYMPDDTTTSCSHMAQLTFQLPGDEWEFYSAIHGAEYRGAIMDFIEHCRQNIKSGLFTPQAEETWAAARQWLTDELASRGVLHDME